MKNNTDQSLRRVVCKYHCPLEYTLDTIGGRWKAVVLWWIFQGFNRFSELRAILPQVSAQSLSRILRDLVSSGVLVREQIVGRPPQVFYHVTDRGLTLKSVLGGLSDWGTQQLGDDEQFGYELSLTTLGVNLEEFKSRLDACR